MRAGTTRVPGIRGLVVAALMTPGVARGQAEPEAVLERQMFLLLNRDRAQHRLAPLAYSDPLASVARGHSLELSGGAFFAHESPTTGAPAQRIFRAGIPASRTAENIARDTTIPLAQEHLMLSPGHRANILTPDFTHIGIGVVRRGNDLFVTQNFIRALPRVDTDRVPGQLVTLINQTRRRSGAGPVALDERLSALCERAVETMNQRQDVDPGLLTAGLKASGIRYFTVQAWAGVVSDPRQAAEAAFLTKSRFNAIGIGVARNETQEHGLGMLWVAVLIGEVR